MVKQNNILILGAGIDQVYAIKKAKELDLSVICVDQNAESPGFKYADFYKVVSTRDIEGILQFCSELSKKNVTISSILVMGTDIPDVQAKLAQRLKVNGPSLETAELTTNKYLMKKKLLESNIKVPWFKLLRNVEDFKKTLHESYLDKFIIKPIDRSGARGVFLINKIKDKNLDILFFLSQKESFSGYVQIEEYIEGPQISTESLIINKKAYTPGFVDRNYEMLNTYYPYVIENGGNHPSVISKIKKNEILDLIEKSASALGINDGVAKGDIVISNKTGKPYLIEMASRLSGGDFSESLIPIGCGVDIVKFAIKLFSREFIDVNELKDKHTKYVANRYFFGEEGIVEKIVGVEILSKYKWLRKLKIFVNNGDTIKKIDSHASRIGVFIVQAENLDLLNERISLVYKTVQIITS